MNHSTVWSGVRSKHTAVIVGLGMELVVGIKHKAPRAFGLGEGGVASRGKPTIARVIQQQTPGKMVVVLLHPSFHNGDTIVS